MGSQYRIYTVDEVTSGFVISVAEQHELFRALDAIIYQALRVLGIAEAAFDFVNM